jgi:hypothetical protein
MGANAMRAKRNKSRLKCTGKARLEIISAGIVAEGAGSVKAEPLPI